MTKAVLRTSTRLAQSKVHKARINKTGHTDKLAKLADAK